MEDAEEATSVETPRVIVEIQSSLIHSAFYLGNIKAKKGPNFIHMSPKFFQRHLHILIFRAMELLKQL